jgi:hypothetical protein
MTQFKSTDDKRTENNGTRQSYRQLTDAEKQAIDWIKAQGEEFIDYLDVMARANPSAGREFALAKTHAEDAVMRAVRGITQ